MLRQRWKRLAASVLAAAGLSVGAMAGMAGATPANPGPSMGCVPGTDSCGGWAAAHVDPTCQAYRIDWSHNWYNVAGGYAYWHVTIYLWWNGGPACEYGGAAHQIALVGDFYHPDYETPNISNVGGYATLRWIPHGFSGTGVSGGQNIGTGNTLAWTPCNGVPSDEAYNVTITGTTGQTRGAFQNGWFSTNTIGGHFSRSACEVAVTGSDSHDGTRFAPTQPSAPSQTSGYLFDYVEMFMA